MNELDHKTLEELEELADALEAAGDTRLAKIVRLARSGTDPTEDADLYPPALSDAFLPSFQVAGPLLVAMSDVARVIRAATEMAAKKLGADLGQGTTQLRDMHWLLISGAFGNTSSTFAARAELSAVPEVGPALVPLLERLTRKLATIEPSSPAEVARGAITWLDFVAGGRAFALLRDEVAPRITKTDDRYKNNALAVRLGDHAKGFSERATVPARIDAYLESLSRPLAEKPWDFVARQEESGILFLDELFARDLEGIGDTGRKAAAALRKSARERMEAFRSESGGRAEKLWEAWNRPASGAEWEGTTSPRWIVTLARALWFDVVGPTIDREKKNPPALVYPVHEDVARIHSRARRLEERNGQRALTFDDGHDPIVTIADEAIAELVDRGASLLGSVLSHRALRWEINEGHSRALRGIPDARVLRIDGGWSTFAADVLKLKKKDAAEDLRAIVHAQAAVHLKLPNGDTAAGLVTLRESPQRGNKRASIEIVLGTMLLPHYVHELSSLQGRLAGESKRLVPVVELPPMVGRNNEHGPQATISMLVVQELRKHARSLFAEGSVAIDQARWGALAKKAGLPHTLLRKVLDRWTKDGDDGPAFLEEPSPGRYQLGRAHSAAQAFIVEAGRTETISSEAGRRSVAARERKRQRLGRGRGRE